MYNNDGYGYNNYGGYNMNSNLYTNDYGYGSRRYGSRYGNRCVYSGRGVMA
jgi:hypothetical protein